MARWWSASAALGAAVLLLMSGTAARDARTAAGLPLVVVDRVPLPGPPVRFDYTSLDQVANRLYIAHMDAGELVVLDVRTRRVIAQVRAPGVHGVIAVPELGRVFVSATDDREVLTIDARRLTVVASAPAGAYPDGLAYDPVVHHVFVSDEQGGVETVLNASGRRVATIALGGEAGNVQYDAGSRDVLVDVQTLNQLAVIDPESNRIVRRVHLPFCANDHGLYVDASRRIAFIACDENATLLTLDLRTFRVTGHTGVGAYPDVLAFDTALRRLYVSAESGIVSVFAVNGYGLRKLGEAFLASEAHTVAVDSRDHLVYFPLQSGTTGRAQLLIMKPAR